MSSFRNRIKSFTLVATCSLAMIANSANNTSVAISLSTLQHALCIRETRLQWLISGYSLSSGCLLLLFGRYADLYGRKQTFIGGSLWLLAFTLGCGFAKDAVTLDILRAFQGAGGAATIPACLGILAHAFPQSSQARSAAFASFSAGAPIGAAIGMALGAALIQTTAPTWRTPFFLESGLYLLCIVGGVTSVEADVPSTVPDKRLDWFGAFLVTAGLVLITFVLGQGEVAPQGWRSRSVLCRIWFCYTNHHTSDIVGLLLTGLLSIFVFVLWQARLETIHFSGPTSMVGRAANSEKLPFSEQDTRPAGSLVCSWMTPPPLMKLSLWGSDNGLLAVMMCIAFLTSGAFLGWAFWAQLYYQDFLDLSPLDTVLRLLPMFISGIFCNVVIALLVARIPPIFWLVTGTLGTCIACLLLAVINPNAPYWAFGFPSAIVAVFGADFVFAVGTLYVASVVEPHEQSLAGGLFQTMTQIGTTFGLTVTTVIFHRVSTSDASVNLASRSDLGRRFHPCLPSVPHASPFQHRPSLESYQSAQWGCFAFGIFATLLAITFFRRVGVTAKKTR